MIATVLTTLALAALAMAPGLLLMREGVAQVGQRAAAATASLVCVMLATALLGELSDLAGFGQLPATTLIPVSLTATLAAWWHVRMRTGKETNAPIEWQGAALATLFVGFGFLCQALAVREDASGALLVHAWYNADWFKHLGHVAALADYGVPARDTFNNGEPLHYYWLSYVLPGAGAAIGGDNWAALDTANVVVTALFCFTFYGAIRSVTTERGTALVATTMALFVCAPVGFVGHLLFGGGIEPLLNGPSAPKGPALLTLSQYIPQHTLTITVLLAWIVLNVPNNTAARSVRLLGLGALAPAMALSTLLGAMVLAVYGLLALWERRHRALLEVGAMVVVSGALVLVLGVVAIDNPTSAIESPLLANPPDPRGWPERAVSSAMLVVGNLGLPLLLALFVVRYWRPQGPQAVFAWRSMVILLAVGIAAAVASELLLTSRLAIETRIRAVNLPAISIAMIGAWAISRWWSEGRKARYILSGTLAVVAILALPSAVIRTVWHWQLGDRFTTVVPQDDRAVLGYLKRESAPRAIVWQYPEPPLLATPGGDDAWAVVLAGRTVTGSQRATNYASAAPRIKLAERYFAGEPVALPASVDWIYFSRRLHPASYNALVARTKADAAWRVRACYADACLFSRATLIEAK